MNDRIESFVNYLVLVAIAAALVWFDMRLLALYSFMVIVGLIIHFLSRLWKLITVTHESNAGKLLVIAKKLGVSDDEYDQMAAEIRAKDPQAWASAERFFRDR